MWIICGKYMENIWNMYRKHMEHIKKYIKTNRSTNRSNIDQQCIEHIWKTKERILNNRSTTGQNIDP